jgi:microcystin-dependent protein
MNPFVGEIRLFAGNFAPQNWHFCDGTLLAISEFDTLYALLGTTYGGDGQTTFALPDLRGRVPMHFGQLSGDGTNFTQGQRAGEEQVTLTLSQIPLHNHSLLASTDAAPDATPVGNVPGATSGTSIYKVASPTLALGPAAVANAGGNQPHDNVQPFVCVGFIMSLFGIFPTRN